MSQAVNPSDPEHIGLVFVQPRYIAYAQYSAEGTSLHWSVLPIPAALRGADFSTEALVALMRNLMDHLILSSPSSLVGQSLVRDGTPMGFLSTEAIKLHIVNDTLERITNGWGSSDKDAEIDKVYEAFQPLLVHCVVTKSSVEAVDDPS